MECAAAPALKLRAGEKRITKGPLRYLFQLDQPGRPGIRSKVCSKNDCHYLLQK